MDEKDGLKEIEKFLQGEHILNPADIGVCKQIMSTMSYSKVKQNGFPNLGCYQTAYNIVREADLLSSYDFDRTMIYNLNKGNSLKTSYSNSMKLFEERVFNYNTDKLFVSEYAKQKSYTLTLESLNKIKSWSRILSKSIP
jgi:hypothetical protein